MTTETIILDVEANNNLKGIFGKMSQGFNKLKEDIVGVNLVLNQTNNVFQKTVKTNMEFGGSLTKMATNLRQGMSKLRGFKMELLGILFFMNMVSNAMFKFLRPAGDAVGIFDLWKEMLVILFLPVMMQLLPLMMDLLNWIVSWDDETKLMVGQMVLLVGTITAVIGFLAALALSIAALMAAGMLGWVIGIGAAIVLLPIYLYNLYKSWKENFDKIQRSFKLFIDGIKKMWEGLKIALEGAKELMIALWDLDWGAIKSAWSKIFSGLETMLEGWKEALTGIFVGITIAFMAQFMKPLSDILEKLPKALGGGEGSLFDVDPIIARLEALLPKQELAPNSYVNQVSPQGQSMSGEQGGMSIQNNYNGFTQDDLLNKVNEENILLSTMISSGISRGAD